ncbi:MAG: Rpn family recombination-promoting nuclease/putative transposase [Deferrisomatales bacterium]
MADVPSPHDAFFRQVFSRPEAARDLAAHYLPPEVAALLDLSSLAAAPGSFVDAALRSSYADLLFTARLTSGRPALVYLLFEHKSHPDPDTGFQVLRYLVRVWEQHRRRKPSGPLPPVIPLVVYHGRTRWQVPTRFQTLVDCPPELVACVPDFAYLLCDLTAYRDDEIRGEVVARAALLAMKHIFRDDLAERLPAILGLLRDLAARRTGLEYLHTLLRYLVCAADTLTPDTLTQALAAALPATGGTDMPTIAEQWIEQGRQQGIEQGIERGIERGQVAGEAAVLVRLVERKFGGLPQPYRTRIGQADSATLLRWAERVLTAATAAEVFED